MVGDDRIHRLPDGRVLEPGMHRREDKKGRCYLYDRHGDRVYRRPLRGTPRDIPLPEWLKLTPESRTAIVKLYSKRAAESSPHAMPVSGEPPSGASSSSSSSSAAPAAAASCTAAAYAATAAHPAVSAKRQRSSRWIKSSRRHDLLKRFTTLLGATFVAYGASLPFGDPDSMPDPAQGLFEFLTECFHEQSAGNPESSDQATEGRVRGYLSHAAAARRMSTDDWVSQFLSFLFPA